MLSDTGDINDLTDCLTEIPPPTTLDTITRMVGISLIDLGLIRLSNIMEHLEELVILLTLMLERMSVANVLWSNG
jgi:hypothetical protein